MADFPSLTREKTRELPGKMRQTVDQNAIHLLLTGKALIVSRFPSRRLARVHEGRVQRRVPPPAPVQEALPREPAWESLTSNLFEVPADRSHKWRNGLHSPDTPHSGHSPANGRRMRRPIRSCEQERLRLERERER